MSWIQAIAEFNNSHGTQDESAAEDRQHLQPLQSHTQSNRNVDPNIQKAVQKAVHSLVIEQKNASTLSNEDLDQISEMLKEVAVDGDYISYHNFKLIGQSLPKFQSYFTPSVFVRFKMNENGHISSGQLYNFIVRRASLCQERVCISMYDQDGDGMLTLDEFEQYLADLIPTFPQLQQMDQDFKPFYLCSAVRKFYFNLHYSRPIVGRQQDQRNCIKITDILLSPILSEFFELQQPEVDGKLLSTNWFSLQSALKVYSWFVELDQDHNGMLSRSELYQFAKGRYTNEFIDRIYQEYLSFNGELDYKSYLDFVLAANDVHTKESMRYMFTLLDIRRQGFLDWFTLHFFMKAQVDKISQMPQNRSFVQSFNMNDMITELFDMAKASQRINGTQQQSTGIIGQIRLNDLINCGVGGTVISLLIDTQALLQNQFKD
ncbi:hypothetical protein MIR68_003612 [Amoeboaphelidium protococcarum]|nr:hypothetical protein MIR68_003612 [Amoeboaphelidium protococcarum]